MRSLSDIVEFLQRCFPFVHLILGAKTHEPVQQKKFFCLCGFCGTMAETTEVFIFLDISEMPFCLDGTNLTVSDPLFTLDICMALLLQFLPVFVNLHDLVLIPVTFFILVSQMNARSLSHSSTIRSTALTPRMFA